MVIELVISEKYVDLNYMGILIGGHYFSIKLHNKYT